METSSARHPITLIGLFVLAVGLGAGATASHAQPRLVDEAVINLRLRGAEEAVLGQAADVGFLAAADRSRVTINAGAKIAYLEASGDSAVVVDGGRISHLHVSAQATVTIKGGAEISHANLSGDARVSIAGATMGSLNVHGQSHALIRELTVRGGIFSAPNVSVSGGVLAYSADAKVHIHATDVDLHEGKLTGFWGTGEPFAFWVIEAKGPRHPDFTYSRPRLLPPQIVVHHVIVAGFDCSKAIVAVEPTLCADRELARRDRQLARQYERALAAVPENADLRSSQRSWLTTVRDRCGDSACIRSAYEKRSAELQSLVAPHGPGYVPLISETKAQTVCDEVVRLANAGDLERRVLRPSLAPPAIVARWSNRHSFPSLSDILEVDYNREGKKRVLAVINTGGSCHSSEIVDLELAMSSPPAFGTQYVGYTDLEAAEDQALRWASW